MSHLHISRRAAPRPARLARILVLGYLLVCAGMYLLQDRLIFHRTHLNQQRVALLEQEHPGCAYRLATRDGAILRGWLDVPAGGGRRPLLLYFGGNAQEVSGWMRMRHQAPDWAWAALNYRGYGASTGKPSQQALVADAVAEFDALSADPRIDPRRIVVVGRSLGSGVAVQLAAQRPLKALVLATPFDSLTSVASERYPIFLSCPHKNCCKLSTGAGLRLNRRVTRWVKWHFWKKHW